MALLGQGRENSKQFLHENLEVAQEIELVIREQFDLGNTMVMSVGSEDYDEDDD